MQIKQTFDISTGWLIDGTGEAIRTEDFLEVRDGRIASIGVGKPAGDLPLLDLSHCTILPGLIDGHVHLCLSGTEDPGERESQLKAPFEAIEALIRGHLMEHLSLGVVALRDGGDRGGHTLRYRKQCLNREETPCRLRSAGRGWHAAGRYGALVGRAPLEGRTLAQSVRSDPEDADHVKIVNSGINSLTHFGKVTPSQFSPADLKAAVRAATERGLKTMVHANGEAPVRTAIEAGAHSIEHGFFMGRENLRRMADRGVFWVPTAWTMAAYARRQKPGPQETGVAAKNLDHQMDQIRAARDYGVPMAVGTDAGSPGVHHGRAILGEIGILLEVGLSLEEAVRCATLEGARLLGLEGEMGVLRPGMAATFLAVKGGPEGLLDALRSPRVFIRGREWTGAGASKPKDEM